MKIVPTATAATHKEEQALLDTVWRRTGRNVFTIVQHGKPDNSSYEVQAQSV